MNSGIYEIKNKINGKRYIGSALDFDRRWKVHIRLLKNNNHHSKKLQNAWNKYGENNFEFNILHRVYDIMLISFEQACLDKFWNEGLYNICPTAGSFFGMKHSDETKKKISDAKKGKTHSEESCKNMSQAQKGRTPPSWKGKTHSEETLKKMSDAKKGKTFSEDHCKKLAESQNRRKEKLYQTSIERKYLKLEKVVSIRRNQKRKCQMLRDCQMLRRGIEIIKI